MAEPGLTARRVRRQGPVWPTGADRAEPAETAEVQGRKGDGCTGVCPSPDKTLCFQMVHLQDHTAAERHDGPHGATVTAAGCLLQACWVKVARRAAWG